MFDQGLIKARLDCRQLLYKYNVHTAPLASSPSPPHHRADPSRASQHHPGQEYVPGMDAGAQFGPDDRFQILQKLFALDSLDKAKRLAIEPPFASHTL